MTDQISVEDWRRMTGPERRKYRNRRVLLDGFFFDSQAEAARYGELRILERTGAIRGLVVHPTYVLQPAFKHDGKRERAVTYIADFEYIDCQTERAVVEDVKGVRTQAYSIKRRLFLAKYGKQYDFVELRV